MGWPGESRHADAFTLGGIVPQQSRTDESPKGRWCWDRPGKEFFPESSSVPAPYEKKQKRREFLSFFRNSRAKLPRPGNCF